MAANNPYAFAGGDKANADALNNRLGDIALRLAALEKLAPAIEAATNSLVAIGLQRLNTELLPTIQLEQQRVERGVLVAGSTTPVRLLLGATVTLAIDPDDRMSFSPATFVALTRVSTLTDYATLRTQSWDPATGAYQGTIVAVAGNPGPWADWELGSQAGTTEAQRSMLASVTASTAAAAASAANALANRQATDADAAQTAADRAAVASSIQAGGVLSVAGRHGAVTLTPADVPGVATQTDLQSAINGLENGAPAALDTLRELADALGDDANYAGTVTAALGARLRFDAPQGLTVAQQTQARSNAGAASARDVAYLLSL